MIWYHSKDQVNRASVILEIRQYVCMYVCMLYIMLNADHHHHHHHVCYASSWSRCGSCTFFTYSMSFICVYARVVCGACWHWGRHIWFWGNGTVLLLWQRLVYSIEENYLRADAQEGIEEDNGNVSTASHHSRGQPVPAGGGEESVWLGHRVLLYSAEGPAVQASLRVLSRRI